MEFRFLADVKYFRLEDMGIPRNLVCFRNCCVVILSICFVLKISFSPVGDCGVWFSRWTWVAVCGVFVVVDLFFFM